MKGQKVFLSILDDNFNDFKKENITIERLNDEISYFESFIPDFFSKNGEADGIRKVYSGIRENLNSENTINCMDINRASKIYNEYMEGMVTFINDIKNVDIVTESNELTDYSEKFSNVKANSNIFIESLFNGGYCPYEDTVLSEAVANIECLIEFIPELSTIKNICNSLGESVTECTQPEKTELLKNSIDLLYESVCDYCYSTIRNIVSTYYDINSSLFEESTTETTDEVFRLF